MFSLRDHITLPAGEDSNGFEALGSQLLKAMSTYTQCLKNENLPLPSPQSLSSAHHGLKSVEGQAAKHAIIELAQTIYIITMDPELSLLISSLQFHFCSCLKVAIDLRVHEHIPLDSSIALSELANRAGVEEALLVRIMRVLIKKHVFMQPEPGYYSHTQISLVLRKPNMNDLVCHRFVWAPHNQENKTPVMLTFCESTPGRLDEGFRSASREPEALAAALYREPRRGVSNGFNLAYGTKKAFWDYIADDSPRHGERFARAMHAVNINSLDVISRIYPFDTLAADGGLIVDIGGGQGHVAKAILTSFRNSGLKCIVQDVHVNASSVAVEEIEMQQHDFFDPQPIHGAAAYFFRHILHDWPDNACVTLLRQTARVMDRDRSRILICDQVMHDSSRSEASILYDIDMMSLFGGKERSFEEWTALVDSADAGLKITNVMLDPGSEAAMLELRLQ